MSILLTLTLTLTLLALPLAAETMPSTKPRLEIVLLTIEDGRKVEGEAIEKLQRLLLQFNSGARVSTIHESGREWVALIEREAATIDAGAADEEVINEVSSAEDSVAARVRADLTSELAKIPGPIDQLVIFAPIVGGTRETMHRFHIMGVGRMTDRGFDPKVALALSPLRRRLAKSASIVFLGGDVLGPSLRDGEDVALRVLDFFGASEGHFFGLRRSRDEAQSIALRRNWSAKQMLGVAGMAGAVSTLGWYGDVMALHNAVLATVIIPWNLNAFLSLVDLFRKIPKHRRQTKFGLDFKGFRIDREGIVRPLEVGRDDREILTCAARLETS